MGYPQKIIFFLFFITVSATSFAQLRDSVYVKNDVFELVYSEKLEQPKWVKYTVVCTDGKFKRGGMDFYVPPTIQTSNNEDYSINDWDKGHMAPAADFNCNKEQLQMTFSYLNCALQHYSLNRGPWKLLEERERELVRVHKLVNVEIKLVFSENSIHLLSGATVPDGFYKILKYGNRVEKYYFPNKIPQYSDFNSYKIINN
jgi:endonuclease G